MPNPVISETIAKLPCHVELPTEWRENLAREGIISTVENDARRFARKRLPGKGLIEITDPIPTAHHEHRVAVVHSRDISRSGVSFVHAEELYPTETGRLWLEDRRLDFEVTRCERIAPRCYVICAAIAE
ncbi:hypothetical protein Mal64_24600 [Pseudobythopirellula maris]|uniref:PilZ domain-containing protein n=1 Tax=Pseudobythopirellula maris TaxID=2527991 RepID=A0A5C5ZNE8_9BACT|nr:hypothetical protein [Pseudobythopirellula maris]TWT88969.1 hypothetical protein Mal64_24600 [Pseudobythopirellula maris]